MAEALQILFIAAGIWAGASIVVAGLWALLAHGLKRGR
jgi:hypothetical protein